MKDALPHVLVIRHFLGEPAGMTHYRKNQISVAQPVVAPAANSAKKCQVYTNYSYLSRI